MPERSQFKPEETERLLILSAELYMNDQISQEQYHQILERQRQSFSYVKALREVQLARFPRILRPVLRWII